LGARLREGNDLEQREGDRTTHSGPPLEAIGPAPIRIVMSFKVLPVSNHPPFRKIGDHGLKLPCRPHTSPSALPRGSAVLY